MDVKTVAVIGAGTMGNGIAHTFARFGFNVLLIDLEQPLLEKALGTIGANLDRQVKKGQLNDRQKSDTLARIRTAAELSGAASADLVIEAATENKAVKMQIFTSLDSICRPETILASNTSSISITELGAATKRPDKVIGMHFMNPVPVMKLVEVICGHATTDETTALVLALCAKLEKVAVQVNDYPGFVANRVLMPMLNEAMYCVMEGVASPEAVDTVMKLGMNHPMGPLTLADFIGLDVCLAILEVLHEGFGDPKYRPCPLLKKMVAAGHLGNKTGRGFFVYS